MTATRATPRWRQTPDRHADESSSLAGPRDWLTAWLLCIGGPVGWLAGSGGRWMALAVIGTASVWAVRSKWCTSVVAYTGASIACGFVATGLVGPAAGAWTAAGLLLGTWLLPAHGRWRHAAPRTAVAPAVVLTLLASWSGWRGNTGWQMLLPAVTAFAVPVLMAATGPRASTWIDTFARAVGHLISSLLFAVMAVPLVLLPYAWRRLSGVDGFDSTGEWERPPRHTGRPADSWSDDRPRHRRLDGRALAAACGLLLVVAGAAVLVVRDPAPPPNRGFTLPAPPAVEASPEGPIQIEDAAPAGVEDSPLPEGAVPAALVDSPWWSTVEYRQAQDYLMSSQSGLRFENPYRSPDLRSPYINVTDGHRDSWTAPPCDCHRVTVWLYGGSTAWGISQRDDHTIASELAAIAHDHGLTVDVQNRAAPGLNHWQEAERFALDLTTAPPPDLVVFYDGVNDRWWDMGLHDPILESLWEQSGRSEGEAPDEPNSANLPPPVTTPKDGLQLTAEGVARYDLTRRMSRATAESARIPVTYFWQPDRYTRPFEPDEPHFETEQENASRLASQYAADSLTDDVIDLTDVLDDTEGPIYTDDAHHNERGARIIAASIFDRLRGQLSRLASRGTAVAMPAADAGP